MESEGKETESSVAPIWCAVANVVMERPYGPGGEEKRSGTKHFRPGAKVVCAEFFWYGYHSRAMVVGHHRASHRLLTVAVDTSHLTNWRVELVYSPTLIERVREHGLKNQLRFVPDGSEAGKARAEEIVTYVRPSAQPYVSTRSSKQSGEEAD